MLWKFNSEMEFNGHLLGSGVGNGGTRGCEGKRRKQDFAGRVLLCDAVLMKALGNSNFGMSLQSYSELRRGGWTFIPLGEGM